MPTLILTVGLPRSGKSTWAQQQGHPVVNLDAIRLALHGQPHLAQAEPMVWVIARYMVNALFLAGHATVILDATNITVQRRQAWIGPQWTTTYQTFPTSEAECVARALSGNRAYLVPVIQRMARQVEWPNA